LAALAFAGAAALPLTGLAAGGEPVKVVYHLSEGTQQASRALGNIRNHLKAEPGTTIVVVAHGAGIDFLLEQAQDAKGRPFVSAISELAGRGVEFRACNNTLEARDIPREQIVPEAVVVDSGVAEVARLQAREGFVYLRP
jgi:intracellular sulfur oxidation DsrE/DsrF family protein